MNKNGTSQEDYKGLYGTSRQALKVVALSEGVEVSSELNKMLNTAGLRDLIAARRRDRRLAAMHTTYRATFNRYVAWSIEHKQIHRELGTYCWIVGESYNEVVDHIATEIAANLFPAPVASGRATSKVAK